MADPPPRPLAERAQHDFDLATSVTPAVAAGGWAATIDAGWTVGGRPNGGYLLAVVTRAALASGSPDGTRERARATGAPGPPAAAHPDPIAVSGHFLSPPAPGPAELEVTALRAGRSVSTYRVGLTQAGRPCLEALVTAGRLDPAAGPVWRAAGPPELPPPGDCVPGRPELPGGMRVAILDHLDVRLDPATAGWMARRPAGRLEMRGRVRFQDGRPPDPLALLQAVDALPPVSFELGIASWAPTVELTAYVRHRPAPGWLRCAVRGRLLEGGWFDEEAEVWDATGALVAQSRQLAGARDPAARGPA
jgi:acyl-CoA thioesterase